jgi:hypothetical protein
VAEGSEHLTTADRQTGQASVGCQPLTQDDQAGHPETRAEDLEGSGLRGGGPVGVCQVGQQLIDDAGATLLAVGKTRRGRVFGDPVIDAIDEEELTDIRLEGHADLPTMQE